MNCSELKNVLPFLDDGSLNSDTENDARAHLAYCDDCRAEYEEIIHTMRLVNEALSQAVTKTPADFLDGIRQKITVKKRQRFIEYRLLPVAAVFVAAITISFYSLIMHRTIQPDNGLRLGANMESELSSYVAEQYFDVYEVYALAEDAITSDMYDVDTINDMVESGYVNVGLTDILYSVDEDTALQLFER